MRREAAGTGGAGGKREHKNGNNEYYRDPGRAAVVTAIDMVICLNGRSLLDLGHKLKTGRETTDIWTSGSGKVAPAINGEAGVLFFCEEHL